MAKTSITIMIDQDKGEGTIKFKKDPSLFELMTAKNNPAACSG